MEDNDKDDNNFRDISALGLDSDMEFSRKHPTKSTLTIPNQTKPNPTIFPLYSDITVIYNDITAIYQSSAVLELGLSTINPVANRGIKIIFKVQYDPHPKKYFLKRNSP